MSLSLGSMNIEHTNIWGLSIYTLVDTDSEKRKAKICDYNTDLELA